MPRAHIYDTLGVSAPPPSLRLVHAFRKNLVREPDAGNPHVRFDERGRETEHGDVREAPATERAGHG